MRPGNRRKKRNRNLSVSTASDSSQTGRHKRVVNTPTPDLSTDATNKITSLPTGSGMSSQKTSPSNESSFTTANPFSVLQNDQEIADSSNLRPPPIFVKDIKDFSGLVNALTSLLGTGNFICKARQSDVAINTRSSDDYRAVVHHLREINIPHHTYQLKEDKAYRVVIRHLHPSTPLELIKEELIKLGFQPRNITNVYHPVSKEKLPLFFIDLEPAAGNQNIFKVTELYYCKIKIEEPYKKKEIVQCKRCQNYGHTQKYCNYQHRCVKCTGLHSTEDCSKKDRNQPATCVLCGGAHPANYRGCDVHKKLQRTLRGPNSRLQTNRTVAPPTTDSMNYPSLQLQQPLISTTQPTEPSLKPTTYATAAANPLHRPHTSTFIPPPIPSADFSSIHITLNSFLADLKSAIQPLLIALQSLSSIFSLLPATLPHK